MSWDHLPSTTLNSLRSNGNEYKKLSTATKTLMKRRRSAAKKTRKIKRDFVLKGKNWSSARDCEV